MLIYVTVILILLGIAIIILNIIENIYNIYLFIIGAVFILFGLSTGVKYSNLHKEIAFVRKPKIAGIIKLNDTEYSIVLKEGQTYTENITFYAFSNRIYQKCYSNKLGKIRYGKLFIK